MEKWVTRQQYQEDRRAYPDDKHECQRNRIGHRLVISTLAGLCIAAVAALISGNAHGDAQVG